MTDYLEEALGFDREEEADWALEPEKFWAVRAGDGSAAQELPRDDRNRAWGERGGGDMTEARREEAESLWPRALAAEIPPDLQAVEAGLRTKAVAVFEQGAARPEEKDALGPGETLGLELEREGPADAFWWEAAGETLPLLDTLKAAERGTRFVQGERRAFSVTLPESGAAAEGLSVESLDRAVERDAWRYGGDFALR